MNMQQLCHGIFSVQKKMPCNLNKQIKIMYGNSYFMMYKRYMNTYEHICICHLINLCMSYAHSNKP